MGKQCPEAGQPIYLVPKGVSLRSAGIAPTAWCGHKCCHCSVSPLPVVSSCLLSLLQGKCSGAREKEEDEEEKASCRLLVVQRLFCLTPGRDAAVSSGKSSGGSCACEAAHLAHRCPCFLVSDICPAARFWRGEVGGRDHSELKRKR